MTVMIAKPWAVYNEIEDYAADWIENLIALGCVAPGIVDRRSIEDVRPDDYRGFRQVHLFAGIGVWSYALRRVGVPDDAEVWTGSCPCQPFSAAGQGKGMADERHLWPAFYHLIRERRPRRVFGEQVASKDGLGWLDTLQADLEAAGYACWAVDTCSAGSGAPHIRQRLRIAAEDMGSATGRVGDGASGRWGEGGGLRSAIQRCPEFGPGDTSGVIGVVDGIGTGLEGQRDGHRPETGQRQDALRPVATASGIDWVADEWGGGCDQGVTGNTGAAEGARGECGHVYDRCGPLGDMADASASGWGQERPHTGRLAQGDRTERESAGLIDGDGTVERIERPGPTNGFWGDADWLFGRDGKWRPAQPGTFPLVDGSAFHLGSGSTFEGKSRAGMLKGYGNAIDAEATIDFLEAYLQGAHSREHAARSPCDDDLFGELIN